MVIKIAFDLIGDIAIVDSKDNNKEIRNFILKRYPQVKAILKKEGERKGKLRLRKLKKIYGKTTETVHREYGCLFKMDVCKCFFSPRELTERQRVARQVKPGEDILVMFSGIAPFGILIAKQQPKVNQVYCIELNKSCHKYAKENVKLNRMKYQVMPVLGDVKKLATKYYRRFDRVVMPLPKDAYKYLPYAIRCLRKKGTVHLYGVAREDKLFDDLLETIETECKKMNKRFKVKNKRKVLLYAPRTWKVCIDFEVK